MTRHRLAALLVALTPLAVACSPAASPTPSVAPTPVSESTVPPTPSASPSAVAVASPTPTAPPAKAPPAPKGVKLAEKAHDPGNVGYPTKITLTVTWKSPLTGATEIRVFGVEDCMPPPGKDPAPCLTRGTPLPASARKLIAKGPAAKGSVSWTWPAWEDIGGMVASDGHKTYASIVVAAYNAAGHSRFVIVTTGEFCSACTY